MTTATAIAQNLNVAESAILRVEEWANVFFAVVKGLGARFVSKKATAMVKESISGAEFAAAIASKVRGTFTPSTGKLQTAFWGKKEGESRVYFKTDKGGDCGFIAVATADGEITYRVKNYIFEVVDTAITELQQQYDVKPAQLVSRDALTQQVCRQCHYNVAQFGGLCASCV